MHSETYPQLVPLLILIPALGAFINFFIGKRLGETRSAYVGIWASVLTFIISVLIFSSLSATHGLGTVINAPIIFDGWIRIDSIGLDIPWQYRVDTLTVVMLLVVTGVGSLIHIYSKGYIHGDPKAPRFFAFLNLFLMFMLILVTANNFLMLFVGWEGVGLMSYLLIGFWWDKSAPEGWKNANAARKAMIVNRIGDFGVLMSIFLIFWTFGTLTFYAPGEEANVCYRLYEEGYISDDTIKEETESGLDCAEIVLLAEDMSAARADDHSEDEDDHGAVAADDHGDDAGGHGDDGHGAGHSVEEITNDLFMVEELGVFGQLEYMMQLPEDDPGREIQLGTLTMDIDDVLFLIVIFMLIGVTGKSAQIPLFIWLPDAMAGPTPVSALMHAATMVTAGIFLLVRSNVFLDYAPLGQFIIALTGASTAVVAGFMAAGQWDIKRVLAYSTISQLGFMVAAVGIGAYVAAMFHLVTHAIFKACLFLGSGSVIHGMEHGHHHVHEHNGHGDDDGHHGDDHHDDDFDPQDMRNMGGLWAKMPITFYAYLAATFALAGLFPFAGFWSKDEILLDAFNEMVSGHNFFLQLGGFIVLILLLVAAFFTAFYMWRQIQMVFFGKARSEAAANAPESAPSMAWVLGILGVASFIGGFINVPYGAPFSPIFKEYEFKHWLEPSIPSVTQSEALMFNWLLAIIATLVAGGAIYLAHLIYAGNQAVAESDEDELGTDPLTTIDPQISRAWHFANARMYWDETYYRFIEGPYNRTGRFLAEVLDWKFWHDYFHDSVIKRGFDTIANFLKTPFDIGLIDGIVNGVGWLIRQISDEMRGVQTGYVRTYAVAVLLGVVAVVVMMLLPLLLNAS